MFIQYDYNPAKRSDEEVVNEGVPLQGGQFPQIAQVPQGEKFSIANQGNDVWWFPQI